MAIEKKKIQFEDLISKWWFWVGAILVIVFIGAIFFGEYPDEKEKQEQQQAYQAEKKKKEEEDKQAKKEKELKSFETDAESKCQEDIILKKLVNTNIVSLIAILDYNKQLHDGGVGYDKDGNKIYLLRWNGKNKVTKDLVGFTCWVSQNNGEVVIHDISMNNVSILGNPNFASYDKNGKQMK